MNTENPVMTVQDLEGARELGRLSGEVRVLKWGAAIVITMMFAYLTYLAQQINDVRSDLTRQIAALHQQDNEIRSEMTRQIDELRSEMTRQISELRNEMTRQISELRSEMTQQISELRSEVGQQIGDLRDEVTQQTNAMQEGQAAIRERLTTVEQRLVTDSS